MSNAVAATQEAAFLSTLIHGEQHLHSLPDYNIPRALNSHDNAEQASYLVDADGNAYDPYSLAWRYLGMYIDCDLDESASYFSSYVGTDDVFRTRRRNLNSGEDGDDCSRKLLWAAYRDPGYKDGEIGEYQYYDRRSNLWDDSTCQTKRCAKMNCHAKRSHFQLVGVFKETDGLVDWAEQLIKHEGYCVWNEYVAQNEEAEGGDGHNQDNDNSDYNFMYNRQNKFANGCQGMYLTDSYGNSLYRDIRPLQGGNITDGLYWDEDCTQKAAMTFFEYIVQFYATYYYNEDAGIEVAKKWQANTERWNELMSDFKICQPCRAYSRHVNYDDENDEHRRFLARMLANENDGEGGDERWGYNCYDDAGYENVDQCYKFNSKTDLEPASTEDLERASRQGTILAVKVNGKIYGNGGTHWNDDDTQTLLYILLALSLLGIIVAIVVMIQVFKSAGIKNGFNRCFARLRSRRFHSGLRKAFFDEDDDEDRLQAEISKRQAVIEGQQQEMEQMKLEMDQEYAIKNVELEEARARKDQFVDEPTDDEWEPLEDKFEDEPSDDESGHTDNSSSEGSTGGSGSHNDTSSVSAC
jgi:hypothetical protein